jgi:hypothetical protein
MGFEPETPSTVYENVAVLESAKLNVPTPTCATPT